MGAHFKLIHGFFVHVRGAVHGEFLDARWQGDRAGDFRASAFCGFDNVGGGVVEDSVIKRLEADADALAG